MNKLSQKYYISTFQEITVF
jgi:hypothetical protein